MYFYMLALLFLFSLSLSFFFGGWRCCRAAAALPLRPETWSIFSLFFYGHADKKREGEGVGKWQYNQSDKRKSCGRGECIREQDVK